MCLCVVEDDWAIIVNSLDITEKSAENYSCFIHNSRHRLTLYSERSEGDINSGNSCGKIPRSVKSAVGAFDIYL